MEADIDSDLRNKRIKNSLEAITKSLNLEDNDTNQSIDDREILSDLDDDDDDYEDDYGENRK